MSNLDLKILKGIGDAADAFYKAQREKKLREAHRPPGLPRTTPAHTLDTAKDVAADCLYTGEQIQWDE